MKLIISLSIALILFSCQYNEVLDKTLIQGTWKGTLDSTRIIEYKVYSPNIEDSLTKLVDSVYIVNNVLVNIGKEGAQFFGIRSVIVDPHLYYWEGVDTLIFQKKGRKNKVLRDESGEIALDAYIRRPYGVITKLDNDSLIMRLTVYKNTWKEYVVKLKRRTTGH